jgi:hypothetical protein
MRRRNESPTAVIRILSAADAIPDAIAVGLRRRIYISRGHRANERNQSPTKFTKGAKATIVHQGEYPRRRKMRAIG